MTAPMISTAIDCGLRTQQQTPLDAQRHSDRSPTESSVITAATAGSTAGAA